MCLWEHCRGSIAEVHSSLISTAILRLADAHYGMDKVICELEEFQELLPQTGCVVQNGRKCRNVPLSGVQIFQQLYGERNELLATESWMKLEKVYTVYRNMLQ